MDCLFIVQGEGRGHMTQALALQALLTGAGHRVTSVLVGRSARRVVPTFFRDKIGAPVTTFDSPNFATDGAGKAIRLLPTLLENARRLPAYRRSLEAIDAQVHLHRPDVLINFFDVMGGLYNQLYRPGIPMVCIAHQYLFLHPAYRFPDGRRVDRQAVRLFTRATALGAARRLALSFYPLTGRPGPLRVMPPLLRPALFAQPRHVQEPFLLVYLLNKGYAEDVIRWHRMHPEIALHCFWDNTEYGATYAYDEGLTFHQLDDERFLALMARCRGLVTTAGFESVCEAMYLGKPVLMVPVAGHFEQQCNALDGAEAGAGVAAAAFDIDRLLHHLPRYESPAPRFRAWVATAQARYLHEIEAAAGLRPALPERPAAPPAVRPAARPGLAPQPH